MTNQPHEKTQLEFIAKQVNDLLIKVSKPNSNVAFMTFIFDTREGGYLGYLSSVRRIDAVRIVGEWLNRATDSLSKEQFEDMLIQLKNEKWLDHDTDG